MKRTSRELSKTLEDPLSITMSWYSKLSKVCLLSSAFKIFTATIKRVKMTASDGIVQVHNFVRNIRLMSVLFNRTEQSVTSQSFLLRNLKRQSVVSDNALNVTQMQWTYICFWIRVNISDVANTEHCSWLNIRHCAAFKRCLAEVAYVSEAAMKWGWKLVWKSVVERKPVFPCPQPLAFACRAKGETH